MCLQSARIGQVARAERWLEGARHWANVRESRREQAENTLCAAQLALRCGRPGQASPLLEEADAAFTTLGMQAHRASVQRLLHVA
jgi:hypothetical protein